MYCDAPISVCYVPGIMVCFFRAEDVPSLRFCKIVKNLRIHLRETIKGLKWKLELFGGV